MNTRSAASSMSAAPASSVSNTKPLVLVPACNRHSATIPSTSPAGSTSMRCAWPAACRWWCRTCRPDDLDDLLDMADGVLLTGSPSNVHPSHYGEDVHDASLPLDPDRDAWTLPLIPRGARARHAAVRASAAAPRRPTSRWAARLHQAVHEVGAVRRPPRDARCAGARSSTALSHAVDVEPGGLLEQLLGAAHLRVNSVHGQAVNSRRRACASRPARPTASSRRSRSRPRPASTCCLQWHPGMAGRHQPRVDAAARRLRARLRRLPHRASGPHAE